MNAELSTRRELGIIVANDKSQTPKGHNPETQWEAGREELAEELKNGRQPPWGQERWSKRGKFSQGDQKEIRLQWIQSRSTTRVILGTS